MAEHISMRLDWDETADKAVTAVLGLNAATNDDGSARWDALAICIGSAAVIVTVEPDTDQVIVVLDTPPISDGWAAIPSLAFALGERLGWCWIGINSQGYKDSFTIAFGSVVPKALQPRCSFIAEASSLSCYDLMPHRA